tara:strand:- start:6534 stop:6689 length:156 start_codon:yes stop_codon:yes gene_type:complete
MDLIIMVLKEYKPSFIMMLLLEQQTGKMLQTIRTFEPCDTYAAQIALMVAI